MFGIKKRSKDDHRGLIQGAGTGTSDSIKKDVPVGSYIMPADSTAKLGIGNIKNFGKSVQANVSNGEYALPPEQVHALGAEVLDGMKAQTHQPQGFGFNPQRLRELKAQQEQAAPRLGMNPEALARYNNNPNVKLGKSGKPELFFNGAGSSLVHPDEAKQWMVQPQQQAQNKPAPQPMQQPQAQTTKPVQQPAPQQQAKIPLGSPQATQAQNANTSKDTILGLSRDSWFGNALQPQAQTAKPVQQPAPQQQVQPPMRSVQPQVTQQPMPVANSSSVEWDGVDYAKAAAIGGTGAAIGAAKAINLAPSVVGSAPAQPVTAGQVAKGAGRAVWDGVKNLKAKPIPGVSNLSKFGTGYVAGVLGGTNYDLWTTPTEQYRERFGMQTDDPSFAGDLGLRTMGAASDLLNNATLRLAGKYYQDKQRIAREEANQPVVTQPTTTAVKPDVAAQNKNNTPAVETIEDVKKRYEAELAKARAGHAANTVATQQPSGQQPNPYEIIQNGNSFTDRATQQSKVNGFQSIDDPDGVANLFANTRGFGQQGGGSQNHYYQDMTDFDVPNGAAVQGYSRRASVPYGGATTPQATTTQSNVSNHYQQLNTQPSQGMPSLANEVSGIINRDGSLKYPQRTPEQEAERQAVIRAASTPIAGARGMTANQLRTLSDLQQGEDVRANDVYKTDANNVAALQREAMGQAGQNYRSELGEQGLNSRFSQNLNLDAKKFGAELDLKNRQFGLDATERGFAIRNAQQIESLNSELNSLDPNSETYAQDKESIEQKLARYSGKQNGLSGRDRYMTVGGGQEWDEKAGSMRNVPQQLFDAQTGQYVGGSNQYQQPTAEMIEDLRKDPKLVEHFEYFFGKGSAAQYLKS